MSDDSNYSKRELDHYFKDIQATLTRQNEVLERIETQVLKTNGRVTQSEKDIAELKWWKSSIIWGWGLLLTIILFLANKFL